MSLTFKSQVDVCVLAANYNNGIYLKQFIEGIINSSVRPKKLIIVDDASSDNSISVIDSFVNSGLDIVLVKLKLNLGFANALNKGLPYVDSKYVLRIDPDDIIHPSRIEIQYKFLEENRLIDIVGSNVAYFIGPETNITGKSKFPTNHQSIVQCYKAGHHGVCHGSVMMKSKCFHNEKYNQKNVPAEEYDIFSRLANKKHIFGNIPDVLTFVRVHESSVSNNMPYTTVAKTFKLREKLWRLKTNRLYIFKEFIARNAYRKYISTYKPIRYVYLITAVLMKPFSAIIRITKIAN